MANVPSHSRTRKSHRRTMAAGQVGGRSTHHLDGYEFPMTGVEEVYEQIGVDEAGQITGGMIAPGSINNVAQFAQTIRPVAVVDALPTLPDTRYPVGSTVVLTTTGVLYRNFADSWTAFVGTAAGGISSVAVLPTLPDALYPIGGVVYYTVDGKLYRNVADVWSKAVDGGDISANTILTNSIAAGQITAAKIAAGTITANEIATDTITAGQIAAGAIGASEIAAGAIRVGHFAEPVPGNLVANSGFEFQGAVADAAPTSWAILTGTAANFDVVTTPHGGAYGLRLTGSSGTAQALRMLDFVPVEPSAAYRVGGYLRGTGANSGTAKGSILIEWYDSAQVIIGSAVAAVAQIVGTSATYIGYVSTLNAPATARYAKVIVRNDSTSATNDLVYFDDVFGYRGDFDMTHAAGQVLIDSTGVTIQNGKLTLQDEFGSTSMVASGFSGSWADFIALGVYNAGFGAGVNGVVGLGRTVALPYWTVSNLTGTPTLTYVAATDKVEATFAAVPSEKRIVSDLAPVTAGHPVTFGAIYRFDRTAGTMTLTVGIEFTDDPTGLGFFSSSVPDATAVISAGAGGFSTVLVGVGNADAKYARLIVDFEETVTHNAANKITLYAVWLKHTPLSLLAATGIIEDLIVPDIADINELIALTLSVGGGDYIVDGFGNVTMAAAAAVSGGVGPIRRVYTSTTTWNKPSNIHHIEVECVGSGGGSAGADTTGAGTVSGGGGGGGGGYAKKLFLAADLASDTTFDVTVGNAGAAGDSAGSAPTAGSAVTFAGTGITTVNAGGGGAGESGVATSGTIVRAGGGGGAASGGDINMTGGDGGFWFGDGGQRRTFGFGGNSFYGGMTGPGGADAGNAGVAGSQYGGGAAGAHNSNSQAGKAGAAGAKGVVIVTEYYAP